MKQTLLNGRYIIENKLGSGAFGSIYCVVDTSTSIKYAAKIVTRSIGLEKRKCELTAH
jgi:serine/threonine protein kinase